jgi:hypothetical protein
MSERMARAPGRLLPLDDLAGGAIGWEEDPGGVRFPCTVRAASAREAVLWAVERLAAVGVPVSAVKMPLTTAFS